MSVRKLVHIFEELVHIFGELVHVFCLVKWGWGTSRNGSEP